MCAGSIQVRLTVTFGATFAFLTLPTAPAPLRNLAQAYPAQHHGTRDVAVA